ncbi:ring-cleaving dioxygenase [Arcicella rigui]|uniref:Ring-cleaving dioxygenase n=1 Tax=Arcicella rigui TaxID=797020 RepID=A0ABU5QFD1_9BACT|nr:ring-cleaving dioxygenase [Arcicella rigui]MEA5141584.1 ring-cleaving dioxygenase [Arcicella rigui]
MKTPLITGLHHITAMASDPQVNLDFYAGFLGLRLVKKTVNFDAPDVYHLYYGDETGNAGSIMTFFPFGASPYRGKHGTGQAATTSFSIPMNAIDYWMKRFEQYDIKYKHPQSRFNEAVIYFEDPDGLGLELVANDTDTRSPFTYGHIPAEFAIRGFWGSELWETSYERTEALLTGHLGYKFIGEAGVRRRYVPENAAGELAGKYVDILWDSNQRYGQGGIGTVHHIAFDTPTDETQQAVREILLSKHYVPTQVLDRQYFHSIYFREPGGVLFEVATTPPGFVLDETVENLGTALKLPPWQERNRGQIEKLLQPISLEKTLEKYALKV